MEELTWELDLEAKPKVLQMCAMAYSKTGLDQKAYLCLIEAFKIFKQTKKSKENMKKKKRNVPFFLRK